LIEDRVEQEFAKVVDFFTEEGCDAEIVCSGSGFFFRKGRWLGKTSEIEKCIAIVIRVI
jgi:hypothetical protein